MTAPANLTTLRVRRFGVGLYTGQKDGGADYADAAPLAVAAEEAGFDSFWVTEHHGLPDGYLPSPLVLAAALSSVTSRIALGTGVLLAPLHHPVRLAEDAAVVDRLSSGRLLLGLGIGYAEHEYRNFGVDPATRGARLDALVTALRDAWTGEPFDSPALGLSGVRVTPTPTGHLPVWIGGYAPNAVRRAGLLADGHLVGKGERHIVTAASEQLAQVRDPADPGFTRAVNVACVLDTGDGAGDAARRAFARQQRVYERMQAGREVYAGLVPDPAGTDPAGTDPAGTGDGLAAGGIDRYIQASGDPDQVTATLLGLLDDLAGWANVHLVLRFLFPDPDLDAQLRRVRTFGEQVLPALRAHDTREALA
ncbi:LLM class flavin-dependent oxidoreductase [Pseudonocardia broussonetiae]|uniref:LLM class flavin-dependent oxidoreductase n=1 Tax=Pseudonocardia broussonetiae TaxID=2736640 RepID=A0A6M6JNW7_9PSEU|nr:LLM class flavin-dependent oxidoreductase [Pseudonocardia broussonetiae]QJY49628.1 LLM class flavin-dependent oxidoreductase [Pseudonocardia broussonetiae]